MLISGADLKPSSESRYESYQELLAGKAEVIAIIQAGTRDIAIIASNVSGKAATDAKK